MRYETIKTHTQKKIKLITKYVENWLFVGSSSPSIETLNFVDTMCNASRYACNTKSTAFEVFLLLYSFAEHNPQKRFNLFINDYEKEKVDDLMYEIEKSKKLDNFDIFPSCMDVNEYLQQIAGVKYNRFFSYRTLNILYVDPFDFGTVKLQYIIDFMNLRYTELIYNYMHNDVVRNIGNQHIPQKISSIRDAVRSTPGFSEELNAEQTMALVSQTLVNTNGTKYNRLVFI